MRPPRSTSTRSLHDEKGVALVMAMLVLVVISLLGGVLMMTVGVNRRLAGEETRLSKALNVAEAGTQEMLARIRAGDITMDTANPRTTYQIFLTTSGSVPTLGTDSTAIETRQPNGQWLSYSTATRGPDVLTVTFKTNPARTQIYYYDPAALPAINTVSGYPIYQVTSTGHTGMTKRKIVGEYCMRPMQAAARAALTCDQDVRFIGNAVVCGYNHVYATPPPAGENGRGGGNSCTPYEVGTGDLPGSWTTGSTTNGGTAYQTGMPAANLSNQTGFYEGPWSMLGMSQAEFYSWMGSPTTSTSNLNGILFLDNDGVTQNRMLNAGIHGGTGEGFLYVDGDLTINSTFTYKGLIYVEGDLRMNGQAWVLGGLVVKGRSEIRQNGGATILYSADAINRALSQGGGQFLQLSWREVTN